MGNYDKTFKTICRLCLQHDKTENMVSLIDNSGETGLSFYGATFEKLTSIPVKQNEYLPIKICKKCKRYLEEFNIFVLQSQTNDKRLSKLISFSLKQDLTGEMVKEVICQYTLFCQYFPEESKPTSSQVSTCRFEEDMKLLTEENYSEILDQTSNVKEEVNLQHEQLNQSDSDDEVLQNINTNNGRASPNDSDNVDIFLDSIEKLVSSKMKHEDQRRKVKKVLIRKKEVVRNLSCNICLKTLANPATYDYHMQRHGVCRYICDQCGKGFPVLAEMTQHQVYRHGIGPCLECDHCSFKAGRRIELIEHIRLHTGERPFTCEKCGLSFRRKAIYTNHLKCHNEKSIPCNYCPRKFYRRSEMLAHSNNVHDRMYLYLCRVCNVTYAKAQTVRKHMLLKHGIPREMQGKIVRINKNSNSTLFKETKTGDGEFNM